MSRFPVSQRRFQQLALAGWLLLFVGCEPPGKPNPAEKPILPSQLLDLDKLFAANCAGCHGNEGTLGPAPPLNDPLFVEIVTAEELQTVIGDGRPGTPMPPFLIARGGMLTEEQIRVIAAGIQQKWKPSAPTVPAPPAYPLSKGAGVQAAVGNRERGAAIFSRACAGCHGEQGRGVVDSGVVRSAINVPAFLALISDQAIRRLIITGRADLGMPSYAEHDGRPADFQPLTSADVDDLVALIADWRATGQSLSRTIPSTIQP